MNEMSPHISIDRDAVSAFCRRYHIQRLPLFGSVLRDDFAADSDVDVLVELPEEPVRSEPQKDDDCVSGDFIAKQTVGCHSGAG